MLHGFSASELQLTHRGGLVIGLKHLDSQRVSHSLAFAKLGLVITRCWEKVGQPLKRPSHSPLADGYDRHPDLDGSLSAVSREQNAKAAHSWQRLSTLRPFQPLEKRQPVIQHFCIFEHSSPETKICRLTECKVWTEFCLLKHRRCFSQVSEGKVAAEPAQDAR